MPKKKKIITVPTKMTTSVFLGYGDQSPEDVWFQESEERNGGHGSGAWPQQRLRAANKQQFTGGFRALAGANVAPSQQSALMTALETAQVHFPAAWRTELSLKWRKDHFHRAMQQS